MEPYDVEKLVRRASQTMEDTLDLWWYFAAFGLMYAFLSSDEKIDFVHPAGFDGVAAPELARLGIKVAAVGLDLTRGKASAQACLAAFEERRDYYDSQPGPRKLPRQGTEALFAQGFNTLRKGPITAFSSDQKLSVSVLTK
jgi:hypothetical protein